jgi:hypothetical protein
MVEPYPSYEHGPDYTRASFNMPFMLNPYNILAGTDGEPSQGLQWHRPVAAVAAGIAAGIVATGLTDDYSGERVAKNTFIAGVALGAAALALRFVK